MSEILKSSDGAAADLVARLKQNEAATAEVIRLRVPATGQYAQIIDYLVSLDPVSRSQEMPEIAAGLTKETGRRVTIGSLKNAVERVERARKEAAKQAQLPEFVSGRMEEFISNLVTEFNSQYWFVNENGKTFVFKPVRDIALHRIRYDRIKVKDFREMYMNREIQGVGKKERSKSAADIWLAHPNRRQYLDGVVFDPSGRKCLQTQFNLWQGFPVTAQAGSWSKLKDHIRDIVCAGIEDHFEWFMNWMARMVQFPGEPGHTAIVMRGKQGAGKGIVANALRRLFGQHAMAINNSKHLVGNFNLHLRDLIFLFADEAFFAGDKANIGVLNALITEDTLTIEGKGRDTYTSPNTLHVMMASNEDWVVPASADARRYAVFDPLDSRIGDEVYFSEINAEMENGGHAAMLYELLNRDIAGFNHRKVPQTSGLSDQKALSLAPPFRWWQSCLYWGSVAPPEAGLLWADWVETSILYKNYTDFVEKQARFDRRSLDPGQFGKFLKSMKLLPERRTVKADGTTRSLTPLSGEPHTAAPTFQGTAGQRRGYVLPKLEIAREDFCKETGITVNWSDFEGS